MPAAIKRETVSGEALFILRNLKENSRLGRSNKLADVKTALEPSVSLEFDSYFFFLRKFHYIGMDREAQLNLTDQGERVVDGDYLERFTSEVGEFFQDQLQPGESTDESQPTDFSIPEVPPMSPPPPPPADELDALDGLNELSEPSAPSEPDELTPSLESISTKDIVLEENAMAPPPQNRRKPAPPVDEPLPKLDAPEPRREALAPPPPAVAPAAAPTSQFTPPQGRSSAAAAAAADAERYQRFDPIGSGPLGTVFKGRHTGLGVDVSIKEFKDIFGFFSFLQRSEVLKRLKRELCAQAAVRHPCIVAIFDQHIEGARPFFVMELCKGSLREKLEQSGGKGLSVAQTLRYFLQIAYALRAANAQELTHHNLKPENVLFDAAGNVKLSDFGMGRVVEVDQAKGMPQVFVGTGGMPYLAPELISRAKDAGAPADIYALGILLYEMLTGQIPGRRSPMPSEANNEIPSKIDPIFDKMTQDRRENRYADFDAMLADFYGAFSEGEFLTRGDLILWS